MSDILLSPVFSWWGAALLVLLMFVAVLAELALLLK